jgi:hypothetical protein
MIVDSHTIIKIWIRRRLAPYWNTTRSWSNIEMIVTITRDDNDKTADKNKIDQELKFLWWHDVMDTSVLKQEEDFWIWTLIKHQKPLQYCIVVFLLTKNEAYGEKKEKETWWKIVLCNHFSICFLIGNNLSFMSYSLFNNA